MNSSAEPFEFSPLAPLAGGNRGRASLEGLIGEARAQGHREGFETGLAEARQQLAPAMQALDRAVEQLEQEQLRFCERAERAAVELALNLAEKVLAAALQVNPEAVLEVVAGALRHTAVRDHLVLEVNPDDLELVRDSAEQLAGRAGGIRRLDVISERRVPRGGCVVRTEEGEVDARIGEQLARAAEVLTELLHVDSGNA